MSRGQPSAAGPVYDTKLQCCYHMVLLEPRVTMCVSVCVCVCVCECVCVCVCVVSYSRYSCHDRVAVQSSEQLITSGCCCWWWYMVVRTSEAV